MKAAKKPHRENPRRGDIAFINTYRVRSSPEDKPLRIGVLRVSNRGPATARNQRAGCPVSCCGSHPKAMNTRQPPGYHAQTVPLKHMHSAAKWREKAARGAAGALNASMGMHL